MLLSQHKRLASRIRLQRLQAKVRKLFSGTGGIAMVWKPLARSTRDQASTIVDERLERLYQRVELVWGPGDRKSSKLCVMSFVALLAGETHTDQPVAASPLIGEFASRINDAMPDRMRQELKPFAPRILGTNDHLDDARARRLRAVTEIEIIPRIRSDLVVLSGRQGRRNAAIFRELSEKLVALTNDANHLVENLPPVRFGAAIADLVCHCARNAPSLDARRWYWERAIDLLDRLCDIRKESGGTLRIDDLGLQPRHGLSRAAPGDGLPR